MAMTRAKRRRINRQNASKSTGPRSPEGKPRASMNSTKHGLRIETLALPGEDADAFRDLLQEWNDCYRPGTPGERALIERAVLAKVQMGRSLGFQAAPLGQKVRRAAQGWDDERQEEVEGFVELLRSRPAPAVRG